MKRLAAIALMAMIMALPNSAAAKKIGLSGFGGYQFGGKMPVAGVGGTGDIDFKDDVVYGLSLEVPVGFKPGANLLLFYSMQPTSASLKGNFVTQSLGDVNVHYFQAGALYNVQAENPKLQPFTLATLGATWMDPAQGNSLTKFSFAFGGGIKYWASPKVAVRIQFNLHATIMSGGLWAGFGTGGGNISFGGTGFVQGAILGGLTFGLGNDD